MPVGHGWNEVKVQFSEPGTVLSHVDPLGQHLVPQTNSPVPHTVVLTAVQTPPLHVDPIGQHFAFAPDPQYWLAGLHGTQIPATESLQPNPDGQHAALVPVPHVAPEQFAGMHVLPAPHVDPAGQHFTVPVVGHFTSLVPHVTV